MTDELERISGYLSSGGLFNPELANHKAVRELIIDCRNRIAELEAALKPFAELGDNFSDSEVLEHIRQARKVLGEK